MKAQISSGSRTHRPTIGLPASRGFATLLAVIITTFVACDFTRTRDDSAPPASDGSSAVIGQRGGLWYIRVGQWRADARTVIAAVRYVLESDSQTNDVRRFGRRPELEVAMPTNSPSVLPKA